MERRPANDSTHIDGFSRRIVNCGQVATLDLPVAELGKSSGQPAKQRKSRRLPLRPVTENSKVTDR